MKVGFDMEKNKTTPNLDIVPDIMIESKEDLYKYFDNGIEKDKYVLYSNNGTPFEKYIDTCDSEIEALRRSRNYPNPSIIHADVKYLYHGTLKVLCEVYPLY